MSILYDSKVPNRPKTLKLTIYSSRGIDNGLVDMSMALENNPLVTEENVEVRANYLKERLPGLINKTAMESDAFRQVEEKVKSRYKGSKGSKGSRVRGTGTLTHTPYNY